MKEGQRKSIVDAIELIEEYKEGNGHREKKEAVLKASQKEGITHEDMNRFVFLTDPGRDIDDECCLILLAALSRGDCAYMEAKALVATLAPAEKRAALAQGRRLSAGLRGAREAKEGGTIFAS